MHKYMQAIILAAGLGTRMGELTRDKPKPLLTLENKTLLEHNFEALPNSIHEVVLVVGYLQEQIRSTIGNNYKGRKVVYVEQRELKGTGHAVSLCRGVVHGRFLVLMGDDVYKKSDLEELIRHPLAMLVWQLLQDDPPGNRQALVKVSNNGQLEQIIERQAGKKGDLVNCGAYVLDERYFDLPLALAGNLTDEYGLPQTFVQLVGQGVAIDIVKASYWHKVTAPSDLGIKNKELPQMNPRVA